METQASQLRLAGAQERLISFIEETSEINWAIPIGGDNWTAAVVAFHCATGHARVRRWIESARHGAPIPESPEELDSQNALDAVEHASVTTAETLTLARENYAALRALIESLTPEELVTQAAFGPGGGSTVTVADLIDAAEGHLESHLSRAQSALGHA